jgi:hypothetical protein
MGFAEGIEHRAWGMKGWNKLEFRNGDIEVK